MCWELQFLAIIPEFHPGLFENAEGSRFLPNLRFKSGSLSQAHRGHAKGKHAARSKKRLKIALQRVSAKDELRQVSAKDALQQVSRHALTMLEILRCLL
ncbi:hypothetical protein [Paenibacillus sp. TC-CSREp1]|uniref:hypothetical protein n=1 Tax=Paenibacillus sp. TC-CSREp1 TaxID=3410089 RepID=UPI003CF10790